MSIDISIFETGSGGDFSLLLGDLATSETLFQNIYLSLFGGNVEVNTTGTEPIDEVRQDYWGNQLFYPNNRSLQFNSNTERTINTVPLNTAGRIEIERAVTEDLVHLSNIVDTQVSVSIISTDKLRISIGLKQRGGVQERELQILYDNAVNSVIIEKRI